MSVNLKLTSTANQPMSLLEIIIRFDLCYIMTMVIIIQLLMFIAAIALDTSHIAYQSIKTFKSNTCKYL